MLFSHFSSFRYPYLKHLVLTLFFGLFFANAQWSELSKKISAMLISDAYEVELVKIHKPIDQILVVEIIPPYREFPSIILFKKNHSDWEVVFEGLSPGVIDEQSELLDWHTKNLGVDMILSIKNLESNSFDNETIKKVVERTKKQDNNVIIIPYQDFFHMHMIEENKQKKEFTPYTIDKTSYLNFAMALLPSWSKSYPNDNCMMFNTPKIRNSNFKKKKDGYLISVETYNNQIWEYTFDGIDEKNMYLKNKQIVVKPLFSIK